MRDNVTICLLGESGVRSFYHLPRGWLARWLAVGGCASLAPLLVARIACIILHPTRQTACHHARSGARLGSERQDEDRQTDSHAPPGWLGRIITCIAQHQCPVSTRQSKRKQRTTNQPDDRHRRSLQTHHHKSWIAASLVRKRLVFHLQRLRTTSRYYI